MSTLPFGTNYIEEHETGPLSPRAIRAMSLTMPPRDRRTKQTAPTRDELTRAARLRDGVNYDLVPTLDAGGRVTNADRLAPEVAAQFGYHAPHLSAKDVGRRDAQQAQDYLEGRAQVLGRSTTFNPFAAIDGTSRTAEIRSDGALRRSAITNDATVDEKIDDNALGSHLGADGLPARWNVPTQISGGYGGSPINKGPSLPAGMTAMQGADGLFKVWRDGKFTDDRFASLEEIASNQPLQPISAATADTAPSANVPPARGIPASRPPTAASQPQKDGSAMSVLAPVAAATLLNPVKAAALARAVVSGSARGAALAIPHARAAATGYAIGTAINNLPRAFGSSETLTDKAIDGTMGRYADWVQEPIRPTYPEPAQRSVDHAAAAWFGRGGIRPSFTPAGMSPSPRRPVPVIHIPGESAASPQPVPVIDISRADPGGANAAPAVDEDENSLNRRRKVERILRPLSSSPPPPSFRPEVFQAAADRFNPFAANQGRRRIVGALA